MAAGLGFKTFTTGEVLTAGDVNGYLMQGINVFTNATARDAAITAPAEGQFAFTKDNNSLWYYDGAAWIASGATGDIEGVTAGVGISGGGTSGTVTITNSMATAIDAKGDLVAGTAADTFSRLAVGANGTVLTADSAQATGLKWAAAGGGNASWSLINTGGTSLSGTTTTVTGLSGYDSYMILISGLTLTANFGSVYIRFNSDSGAKYTQVWQQGLSMNSYGYALKAGNGTITTETAVNLGSMAGTGDPFVGKLLVSGGKSTTGMQFTGQGTVVSTSVSNNGVQFADGLYAASAALSSVTITYDGKTANGGGLWIYGSAV